MRLDPKYFVPFLLIIAVFCTLLIVYFNFRHINKQETRFAERVGDGTEFWHFSYPEYGTDEGTVTPSELTGTTDEVFTAILFWASWSGRGEQALIRLNGIAEESGNLTIIAAAVRDNQRYIREFREANPMDVIYVNGTEIYQEKRLTGLPSLLLFDTEGTLISGTFGFSGEEQMRDLIQLINPEYQL